MLRVVAVLRREKRLSISLRVGYNTTDNPASNPRTAGPPLMAGCTSFGDLSRNHILLHNYQWLNVQGWTDGHHFYRGLRMDTYEQYYADSLEDGQLFQDMVMERMYEEGLPILCYSAKRNQYRKGESLNGIEIKHDRMWHKTGNLYIEIKEKSHPENEHWALSGVMRQDNTWIWIIGDHIRAWVFFKKTLINELKSGRCRKVTTDTSVGYLLPTDRATELAGKVIEFGREAV